MLFEIQDMEKDWVKENYKNSASERCTNDTFWKSESEKAEAVGRWKDGWMYLSVFSEIWTEIIAVLLPHP